MNYPRLCCNACTLAGLQNGGHGLFVPLVELSKIMQNRCNTCREGLRNDGHGPFVPLRHRYFLIIILKDSYNILLIYLGIDFSFHELILTGAYRRNECEVAPFPGGKFLQSLIYVAVVSNLHENFMKIA